MRKIFLSVSLLAAIPHVAGADTPAFDRPGIAFAPSVLESGSFTFEQGLPDVSHDCSEGVCTTVHSADTLVRAGLGHALELQLGTSLLNRLDVHGPDGDVHEHGTGDSSIGMKTALPTASNKLSWAALARVTAASGATDFSAGETQYGLSTAVGWALRDTTSLGLFAGVSHMRGQNSYTLSPNIGFALSGSVGAYLEGGSSHVTHAGRSHVAGGGLTWMATPRMQLDMYADRGLTRASTDLQAGFGISAFFN